MNDLMSAKKSKMMAATISIGFMIIHILLFLFFKHYGVKPMAYFNIFSILFYLASLLIVKFEMYRTFAVATYLEVVLHMTLAVYFTGWNSGFQLSLITICIILYYSEYIGRHMKIPFVHSTPLALIGMVAYLIACVLNYFVKARYPLPAETTFVLQIAWGVTVFGMTLSSMHTFVKTAAQSEEFLSMELNHDQLTGLPNRYFIADYLGELEEKGGWEDRWIAMLDIDDFKSINDTYGHNCGDYILKSVSDILRQKDADMTLCRWGGEEFLLLGKAGSNKDQSFTELDQLRKTIMEHHFRYERTKLRITVTIGLAAWQPGYTIHQWIGTADQKLYDGKKNGKNQVVI